LQVLYGELLLAEDFVNGGGVRAFHSPRRVEREDLAGA
jgi:hypothetical protein